MKMTTLYVVNSAGLNWMTVSVLIQGLRIFARQTAWVPGIDRIAEV